MNKKKHGTESKDTSIDMTPMLDIVFIMLIFFIVTTSFIKESGLMANRPKQIPNPSPVDQPVTLAIEINESGVIRMDNRDVDIQRVVANIQHFLAEHNSTTAAVKAHPKTKHGTVVSVMNQAKKAGIEQVSILVGS